MLQGDIYIMRSKEKYREFKMTNLMVQYLSVQSKREF